MKQITTQQTVMNAETGIAGTIVMAVDVNQMSPLLAMAKKTAPVMLQVLMEESMKKQTKRLIIAVGIIFATLAHCGKRQHKKILSTFGTGGS